MTSADGWAAFGRADWERAREVFSAVLAGSPDDPGALDGLGQALWWLGDRESAIEHRRRAYAAYRQRGALAEAALLAVYLAGEHRIDGQHAAGSGWLARARRLLAGMEPVSAHGWLEVEEAKRATDPREAATHAEAAIAIAQKLGDVDVEVMALSRLGLALVSEGRVEEGFELLDEAMAAATGGEASDPLAIGDTCCTTLTACDRQSDFRRAADWCRVVVDFSERHRYTPVLAWCRAIYAGVLISAGDWPLAERELEHALRQADRKARPLVLARLAELRMREGRLDEAEQLLEGCSNHPAALAPLVESRLRAGDAETAEALVDRGVEASRDDPAILAGMLRLRADVMLARGDALGAISVAEQLRELGRRLDRGDLVAAAELASGRAAAQAEDGRALGHLQSAISEFARLEMPLEEARARLVLAQVHAVAGSPLAIVDARAARDVFERLGARRDADEAAALLRSVGSSGRTSRPGAVGELTAREREVLALLATGLSNAGIAERLVISPKTAEHHVSKILGKLGVRTRTEAAAFALREGV